MHPTSWIAALTLSSLATLASAGPFIRIATPHDHAHSKREINRRAVSPDETCGLVGAGANNGYTCGAGNVGPCCSQNGWCGSTDGHCGSGCQTLFGTCSGSVNPEDPGDVDMTCGATGTGGNRSCPAGYCCSRHGYCGKDTNYCGAGCQSTFGTCENSGGGDGGDDDGFCGKQNQNKVCPSGKCCSTEGYCGTGKDYCEAPDCQVGFGTCDSDYTPTGANTSTIARTALGKVKYGTDIYDCTEVPGNVALTYDDGPYIYTDALLNLLASYNTKATFFITGSNLHKGYIDDESTPYPAVIRRMLAEGHQIASHTWSHRDLSTLSEWDRRNEMYKNEMALRNVIGKIPTYMRPPYSSCTTKCMATMKALGYHITYFDLDTEDYLWTEPAGLVNPEKIIDDTLSGSSPLNSNYLSIMHDIHKQTVYNVTQYLLDEIVKYGYKGVTAGECLGDPATNWYRNAV